MRNAKIFSVWLFCALSVFTFAPPVRADEAASPATPRDLGLEGMTEGQRRGGVVLVLSGGGTKGIAHIGVLKVLEDEGIPVVGIVGTSMGSVIGGLYATGYTSEQLKALVLETDIMGLLADAGTRMRPDAGDHRPQGETTKLYQRNFTKDFKVTGPRGMIPAVSLVNFLSQHTAHTQTTNFDFLPIPFACVATDLSTGEAVVMRDGNLASAIRASVSIPGLLEPWPLNGRLLVDGGLVANLPVGIAKDIFPGYPVLAVNLAGPSIMKSNDRFKNLVDVLSQTIDIMTIDSLRRDEAQADLLIYPDVSEFSMLDGSGYEEIYERGLRSASESAEQIIELSAKAPPPPAERSVEPKERIVRDVRVEGLYGRMAKDIEGSYRGWIGEPYSVELVNATIDRFSKREEIATVDIDTYPSSDGVSGDIDVVFSFEKRPPYEVVVDGYTSNLHSHRWLAFQFNARELSVPGDSMSFEGRLGDNSEWGGQLRYFTPLLGNGQWGFALNARRDSYHPMGMGAYDIERYSARAMHYFENRDSRIGIGAAGERTNASGGFDSYAWGPYLYYNLDTLDNILVPTKGLSLNAQAWWNTANVWVSRTILTGYIPWESPDLLFIVSVGLETGDKEHQAYRVLLGDQEELYSLAANPYIGDQSAWARLGFGRNFYNSWWGAIRGEVFAAYGMVMDDWDRTKDAWELGVALSVPGQFLNGKILMIYDDGGEVTFGFTLGIPRWWGSPLP